MRLTKEAIETIDTPKIRVRLADALSFTEQWIIKLLSQNKDNGPLTTIQALNLIKRETGLNDNQILTEELERVAN